MHGSLTERDVERIAEETVRKLLLAMGVNASDPAAVLQMQDDFRHLRDWRMSVDTIKAHGLKTAVGILVTGAAGAMFAYFKGAFH